MTRDELDYEELLRNYGNEYLQENNPDDCLYAMDEMDELFNESAYNAIQRAFYGYDYNPHREGSGGEREPFNPNRDWFGFNGYANLVSVEDYDYVAWMDSHIDDDYFIEWCVEQGYIDEPEDDEEDIEGCKGVGFNTYYPIPHDSHKSFYGKALVIDYGNGKVALKSYNTIVAEYNKRTKTLTVYGWYSATTARHIRSFAAELGISLPAGTDIAGKYKA